MYSRSYYPDSQGQLNLPDNYDGTAFMESANDEITNCEGQTCGSDAENADKRQTNDSGGVFSFLNGSPLLSGLFDKGGIFGSLGLSMPHIGTEEILILATAAFLFFSKSGDRECAIILLLLLFIN